MNFLGIEIGGTKLQLGVGPGGGSPLIASERLDVEPSHGATGILRQIERAATGLAQRYQITRIGCGFGGPVDHQSGRVVKSHQVEGWQDFPLAAWLEQMLGVPAVVANDCDVAGLAEVQWGAGRQSRIVFFVTVGTGIGGGLIVNGQIYRGSGVAAAEIGHLRPGLHADRPDETVESIASGWGIAAEAQARLSGPISHRIGSITKGRRPLGPEDVRQRLIEVEDAVEEQVADFLERCDGEFEKLTAKLVVQAAEAGNSLAQEVLNHATQALGWAIAQMITLVAPQVVVVGGGLSLANEQMFLVPLSQQVARYVFPPLLDSFRIVPAALGEEVVVHGAIHLAQAGDK